VSPGVPERLAFAVVRRLLVFGLLRSFRRLRTRRAQQTNYDYGFWTFWFRVSRSRLSLS
jgi:hypothetical protein